MQIVNQAWNEFVENFQGLVVNHVTSPAHLHWRQPRAPLNLVQVASVIGPVLGRGYTPMPMVGIPMAGMAERGEMWRIYHIPGRPGPCRPPQEPHPAPKPPRHFFHTASFLFPIAQAILLELRTTCQRFRLPYTPCE
jgi:hypothetical protein